MHPVASAEASRRLLASVYPSQKAWDDLLRSIDEKAALTERQVASVLEQQARSA